MKKETLIILVVALMITSCRKENSVVSNAVVGTESEKQDLDFDESKVLPLDDIPDVVDESIASETQTQEWVYSFPEELIQESTTDKYFSRKDWYALVDDNNDLRFDSFDSCNDKMNTDCISVYKRKSDGSFSLYQKEEYQNGVLIHCRNENGDAFSDEYREYDSLGRLQKQYYIFDGNSENISEEMNFFFSYSYDEENESLVCTRISANGEVRKYEELLQSDSDSFIIREEINGWSKHYERRYSDNKLTYYKQDGPNSKAKECYFKYETDKSESETYIDGKLCEITEMVINGDDGNISSWILKDGERQLQWQSELTGFDNHGNWLQLIQDSQIYKREFVYQ